MKKFYLALALLLICFYKNSSAQQLKLSEKTELVLHGNADQADHKLFIQLPKSYGKLNTNYPVIVLLDAQDKTLFDITSATVDRLMYTNDIPEAILVGILQNDRGKELSIERNEGTALKFQHFLKDDLTAYLKRNYHSSGYFTFIGHSLGGQFVTHAMTSDPARFNSVISISGALNYPTSDTSYHQKVLTGLKNYITSSSSKGQLKQRYYFSVGDEGFQDSQFKKGAIKADSLLKQKPNNFLNWHFDYFKGFNHMTTPLVSIPAGLVFIYRDWHFSDSLAMDALISRKTDPILAIQQKRVFIKQTYGIDIMLPYNAYKQFANFYVATGNLIKAEKLAKDMVEQYPDDDEAYEFVADVLSKQGNKTDALKYYKMAQSKSTAEKYKDKIGILEKPEKAVN